MKLSIKFKKVMVAALALNVVLGSGFAGNVTNVHAATQSISTLPKINGATQKTLYVGDTFDPLAGVTATDSIDGDLTSKILVTGTVDTSKAGVYRLYYSVTNSSGFRTDYTRIIRVEVRASQGVPPTITGAESTTVALGQYFNIYSGISATDKDGNNITQSVRITGNLNRYVPGFYTLTYTATDGNGVSASVERNFLVHGKSTTERTAPTITGAETVNVPVGTTFDVMQGITATDSIDGDITPYILAVGTVNTNVPGVYMVRYSSINTGSLRTTAERMVIVDPPQSDNPVLSGVEDITIECYEKFSIFGGVSAVDKDGNDITKSIRFTGNVNTTEAGSYKVAYTAIDKDGLSTTIVRTITVK